MHNVIAAAWQTVVLFFKGLKSVFVDVAHEEFGNFRFRVYQTS